MAARGALGAAAWSALPACARAPLLGGAAGDATRIERSDRPEQWESTVAALDEGWITPIDRFFVRSHLSTPEPDASGWRLEIDGLASRRRPLTRADLLALPQVQRTITLECAGNGRARMPLANTSGTQWSLGAVGNARWGGVPLGALLERVGAAGTATHVWFEGADIAAMPGVPKFIRSIPIGKAREDVLLAHTMNGAPLPPLHGAPLRAVTPGWYGMASTKWLTRISIADRPSDNHFQVRGYRWNAPGEDPAQAAPVTEMRVKSLITHPLDGATLEGRRVEVRGFAWAGPAGVSLVEVGIGDAGEWRPAGFRGEPRPGAWRWWAVELDLPPGRHTLGARATDGRGDRQPPEAPLNAGGYGNNMIHRVTVDVRA